MDNNAAAKIQTALEDWKRPPGHLQITWMKTVLDDLKSHNLTLTEAVYQSTWLRTSQSRGCCLWVTQRTPGGANRSDYATLPQGGHVIIEALQSFCPSVSFMSVFLSEQ